MVVYTVYIIYVVYNRLTRLTMSYSLCVPTFNIRLWKWLANSSHRLWNGWIKLSAIYGNG
jgi:hypothetical protein